MRTRMKRTIRTALAPSKNETEWAPNNEPRAGGSSTYVGDDTLLKPVTASDNGAPQRASDLVKIKLMVDVATVMMDDV